MGRAYTYGLGAKAGLAFELGVDKAIELFSHMFRSVDWHKVDSVTLLAFEFYVNVSFAQFIAIGKLGDYTYDKAKDFWVWIKNKKKSPEDLGQSKKNIRTNVNNTEQLKNSPPETSGYLIQTLMATTEPEDFDAILKVLEAAESEHELKWILRNAQDAVKCGSTSTDVDKGKALNEGIRRVLEFGGYFDDNRANRKITYLKSTFSLLQSKRVEHTYDTDL